MDLSKHRDWLKKYRRRHVARYLLALAKSRAKRKGVPFSITEKDVVIPVRCPALGIKLVNFLSRGPTMDSATLDRLNPELGYIPGNVQVISAMANRIKNNADYTDIMKVGRWLKGLTKRRTRRTCRNGNHPAPAVPHPGPRGRRRHRRP